MVVEFTRLKEKKGKIWDLWGFGCLIKVIYQGKLDIQGLAMTRSFGDNISKSVGVTHKPEMIKVKIDEKDKFILVASDGVWEFISNQ